MPTCVLLIHHVRLVRDALTNELAHRDEITDVHSVATITEANDYLSGHSCEAIVVDSGIGQAALAAFMKEQAHQPCVVVAGVEPAVEAVLPFAQMGVAGYIRPDCSIEDWVATIEEARRGRVADAQIAGVLNQCLAQRLRDPAPAPRQYPRSDRRPDPQPGPEASNPWRVSDRMEAHAARAGLTPRERQIANLMIQGKSNKDIARALDVEVSTIKNHVHAILGKFRVQRRAEVTAVLFEAVPRRNAT